MINVKETVEKDYDEVFVIRFDRNCAISALDVQSGGLSTRRSVGDLPKEFDEVRL